MARGRQFLAARVYDRAESYLSSTIIKGDTSNRAPAWLQAVVHIPPAEVLTRPYPIQHTPPRDRALKPGRQPRNLFRPTKIVHPEDQLRQEFYRDHPWELARPKLVLELDGQDARYRDWSKGLRQPGMALSGERYVSSFFSPLFHLTPVPSFSRYAKKESMVCMLTIPHRMITASSSGSSG
jgi:small subunit ribosomal protein S23